jgi:hypothetical protein
LFNRAEAYVAAPYIFQHVETSSASALAGTNTVATQSSSGYGDLSFGVKYHLLMENKYIPDVIVSLGVTAPTGEEKSEPILASMSAGNGFWDFTPGVQFIRTFDPVVLFWGVDFTHSMARTRNQQKEQPGDAIGYNFGMGFAINDDVSISAQVVGAYQTEWYYDNIKAAGSAREPTVLRLALTSRSHGNLYFEPSVSLGINDDAPDFSVGFSAVYRFGSKRDAP